MIKTNIEEFERLTVEIYASFYRSVTLKSDYVLPINNKNSIALRRFSAYATSKYESQTLGVNWIIDFIELSFHWWYKKTHLKYDLESIKLNWIIGQEAIKRYEKLSKDKKYAANFFRSKIRTEVGLNIRSRFDKESFRYQGRSFLIDGNDREEELKKVFYNQPEGLLWCSSQTTMFNHKSKLCLGCANRVRCLELMKKEMPNLFKLRGYENGQSLRF